MTADKRSRFRLSGDIEKVQPLMSLSEAKALAAAAPTPIESDYLVDRIPELLDPKSFEPVVTAAAIMGFHSQMDKVKRNDALLVRLGNAVAKDGSVQLSTEDMAVLLEGHYIYRRTLVDSIATSNTLEWTAALLATCIEAIAETPSKLGRVIAVRDEMFDRMSDGLTEEGDV